MICFDFDDYCFEELEGLDGFAVELFTFQGLFWNVCLFKTLLRGEKRIDLVCTYHDVQTKEKEEKWMSVRITLEGAILSLDRK